MSVQRLRRRIVSVVQRRINTPDSMEVLSMCEYLWLPKCLHWPFCPGVFIAILAVVAGAVTFWEHPPRWFKAISICTFILLMSAEVWMMSKDRDRNDADQGLSRTREENNFREIASGWRPRTERNGSRVWPPPSRAQPTAAP